MGKIISFANQKGGVGKTTSCVNIAASLGLMGHKVLIIDLDPQGNTTSGGGVSKKGLKGSTKELLTGEKPAKDIIVETPYENLSVIPTNTALAGAEFDLFDFDESEFRMKKTLADIKDEYDYILIDCPPALGLLTLNALVAADTFLIPAQPEYYALEGLSQLIATVRQVKRLYNPTLELEGVLFTMYDGRTNLTQQVVAEVKKFFPRRVYATVIPRTVRLAEAPSYGRPINYYDKGGKGAKAYAELAKEILSQQ